MKWRSLALVVFLSSVALVVPTSTPKIGVLFGQPPAQFSPQQLHQRARSITVKIIGKESLGSGILIKRQGAVYTVLTNDHVLIAGDPPYQIETPDGRIYTAQLPRMRNQKLRPNFQGKDLGLLQFRSPDVVYAVASIGTGSSLAVGDEVFAGGFPYPLEESDSSQSQVNREEWKFTAGRVSLLLDKALEGGYRIGYTNDIEKGMSGGPLLNRRGEVVGINGMHAEPLWGDPYVYEDGSDPSPSLREQMSRYSWGIPIETFVQLAHSKLINKDMESSWIEVKK